MRAFLIPLRRAVHAMLFIGACSLCGCSGVAIQHMPALPTACTAADLQVTAAGGDAGMGHRAYTFAFTNVSAHRCSVDGTPQVRPLNAHGVVVSAIPVTAAAGGYLAAAQPARKITLAPGVRAWFQIGFSVIRHGDNACPRMTALRIGPPGSTVNTGNTGGTTLPLDSRPCDGVRVMPVRATDPLAR